MSDIGPQLPSHLVKQNREVGPVLPHENVDNTTNDDGNSSYGPALPPGFSNDKSKKVIGPALPPHLIKENDNSDESEDDDNGDIGPILPLTEPEDSNDRLHKEFEQRANAMKEKLEGKSDPASGKLQRETWMTELPEAWTKNFGVGARKFRTNQVDVGDQSVWTDTPADKERKRQEALNRVKTNAGEKRKVEPKREPTAEEKAMEESVTAYNQQSRPQSLLDMHREKRKKDNDGKPNVRRPFDRERDLSYHRHDNKSKSRIIDQAKGLNSKFSKGTYESKFL